MNHFMFMALLNENVTLSYQHLFYIGGGGNYKNASWEQEVYLKSVPFKIWHLKKNIHELFSFLVWHMSSKVSIVKYITENTFPVTFHYFNHYYSIIFLPIRFYTVKRQVNALFMLIAKFLSLYFIIFVTCLINFLNY